MAVIGSREELLVGAHKWREDQTSGGRRQVGAPSRWMVTLHPVELGRRSGCKERAKRRQRVKYGGAIGVRYRGGNVDP